MIKKSFVFLFISAILSNASLLIAQNDNSSSLDREFIDSLMNSGKFQQAIDTLSYSLQCAEENPEPDMDHISECMGLIGVCYTHTKQCEDAISYLEQAVEFDKQLNFHKRVADSKMNIGVNYKNLGLYEKALEHYSDALLQYLGTEDTVRIASLYNNLGALYRSWSEYDKAIEYYEKCLKIKEGIGDSIAIAKTVNNFGLVYYNWGEPEMALKYFEEALRIDKEAGNDKAVVIRLNNIGLVYSEQKQYENAFEYYNMALNMYVKMGNKSGIAKAYNNIGMVYKDTKDYKSAINYLDIALLKYRELNLSPRISKVLSNIGDCYRLSGNFKEALEYFNESLDISEKLDDPSQNKTNYLRLSQLFSDKGDYKNSLEYYKKYTVLDSIIFSREKHRDLARFEIKYETEKKDKEIKLMKQNEIIHDLDIRKQKILRNAFIYGFISVFVLAIIIFYGLVQKRRVAKVIQAEKEKSDELLHNILPSKVASDLKERGRAEPEMFENVTVFFSDIVGFTERSSELEPQILISELNDIFTGFDNIIEKNFGERIKTIGDAYLAVCGLPESNPNHADNIVSAALEIVDYLKKRNENSNHKWDIRIGVHSGQVVGGVVGVKKYIYDVFGDTINTASRMEVNSAPMRVNISQTTFELVKFRFNFEDRGDVETKGKGRIKMYFVKGLKSEVKI